MSTYTTTWKLDFDPQKTVRGVKDVTEGLTKATKQGNALGDCFKRLKAIDLMAIDNSILNIKDRLQGVTDIAQSNETALAEVSAITGVVGSELNELNNRAKDLSRTYGEDLNENLGSFQTILSRLGPDIGKSNKAMGIFGETVNVLSKGMQGDVKGATDAITTSMLQFQVDLKNPVKAAEESRRMINVMSAGAKEGAAEIPQIGEAIVQAGVSAKLANLSFEETNSLIQAMAGGGKYGSEAGVAIRNVITNMSAQTKLSNDAVAILGAYGINMKKVADTSVPFADRLRELAPIQHDINALTEVFGRENAAAAQIIIRTADEQAELTKAITGTNVAYEQAAVIMDTSAEKEKRRNQRWNIFKLAIGNITKEYQPYINATASAVSITANMKNAMDGLKIVMNAMRVLLGIDTILKWLNSNVTRKLTKDNLNLLSVNNRLAISMIWASITTFGLSVAMGKLKTSINSVSLAIMKIPVIGWLVALIAVLAAVFAYLWTNVWQFRGVFYGLWEVIKLVFGWVWSFIKVHIGLIVALFLFFWKKTKEVFNWIAKIVQETWNSVVTKFQWAWGMIKTKAEGIWNTIKSVFSPVTTFFEDTFGGVWTFVSGVFDKIWEKIKGFMGFFEPLAKTIGTIWDKVKAAFTKGYESQREDKDKPKPKPKPTPNPIDLGVDPAGVATPTKTIDYDKLFAGKEKKKKSAGTDGGSKEAFGSGGGGGGSRTINMTIAINNYFSATKQQAGDVANKVAAAINDRLRDGLVAID
ncbi:phage tail tape measure protein [Soonwooa sp.]|uniref:phage tail tape measure protein n=1 Tax=Soonwooa sp. TaxID=1938592 RepID=UPI0028AAD1E9|nr:phage tail tape measure protein [Soonwooa sp.]